MRSPHRFAVSLFAALLSTFAISISGARAQTTVTSERPATFTLGNGLQVVVIPDHRTPVVTQMIWYKVGSADETPGKSGLAHFLEHLMFKGTSKHPAGEFSQTVLRIGGNENAFTSIDYTGYFQRVPREQLARMMEFEADRMTGLILKDENVLPERDVVLEEYNMRVANNPEATRMLYSSSTTSRSGSTFSSLRIRPVMRSASNSIILANCSRGTRWK